MGRSCSDFHCDHCDYEGTPMTQDPTKGFTKEQIDRVLGKCGHCGEQKAEILRCMICEPSDLQKEVERLRAENKHLMHMLVTWWTIRKQNRSHPLTKHCHCILCATERVINSNTPTPAKESCQCGNGSSGYCSVHQHGWADTPKSPLCSGPMYGAESLCSEPNPPEDGL